MSDTTTQTGGGPIAAPDGGTQGHPRIVPTRPGWWWRETTNGARISEVVDGYGGLVGAASGCPVADASGDWLAPIPCPAVCAALAEYDAARREIVLLAPVGAHPVAKVGEAPAALQRFVVARDSLNVALGLAQVAERDAERDGGA